MSLGPLLPGRIPLSLSAERTRDYILQATREMSQLQDQLGSQKKFSIISDAPAAGLRTLSLQKLLEQKTQSSSNVRTATSLLSATESSLEVVGQALNSAKTLTVAGAGTSLSVFEREALAVEAGSLIRQLLTAGNNRFRDRYLFGGQSAALSAPYESLENGTVRYTGDTQGIGSLIDLSTVLDNNITGQKALGGIGLRTSPDLDPALTLGTRVQDLLAGQGVSLGTIVVQLDDGANNITRNVDLSGSVTIQDIKTRVENAFAGEPVTVSLTIDPGTNSGLRLTPSAGTVQVTDITGSDVAANLGIASPAVAVISGDDLDPVISLGTPLSALNGGTGISLAGGLQIVNGAKVSNIDLTGVTTVDQLLNRVRLADSDLVAEISPDGKGLSLGTRLNGIDFSIGENGGTTATDLGLRSFSATTRLSELDRGLGVPVDGNLKLEIQRRDGSTALVNLGGASTVQDVLDAINAVDPGNLVASLKSVGNGFELTDNSGVAELRIEANGLSSPLGLVGIGAAPGDPLVGSDTSARSTGSPLDTLIRLQKALKAGDNREIQRLSANLDQHLNQLNQTRGEVGTRLKLLESTQTRLDDELVEIQANISDEFEVDYAEVITQISNRQFALEALYQVASQTLRMSIVNYL